MTVPLNWLAAAVCAAAFHELCHILALRATGGKILSLQIGLSGAQIHTTLSGGWQEIFCALAGPAGSFLLLPLCHVFPRLALCALVQGAFNLIPVYPLDGGRILSELLRMYAPKYASCALEWGKITLGCLFCGLGAAFYGDGILSELVLFSGFLILTRAFLRKRPCKAARIRVQ